MSWFLSSSSFVIASNGLVGLKPKSNLYGDILTGLERLLLRCYYNEGNISS